MYRKRSPLAVLLLLALLLSLLAACGTQTQTQAAPVKKRDLAWDGQAVTGLHFYQRQMPKVTVHYALPTLPTKAEKVGTDVTEFLKNRAMSGRTPLTDRIDVWLIPSDQEWPAGMTSPEFSVGSGYTAMGPVALGPGVIAVPDLNYGNQASPMLAPALGLAMNEGPGSPAYEVEWLRVGLGMVFAQGSIMIRSAFGFVGQNGGALLDSIEQHGQNWQQAAAMLSMAVISRWGIHWSQTYPKTPAEMTPDKALLWATGAPDRQRALEGWNMLLGANSYNNNTLRQSNGAYTTAADVSPLRIPPQLPALPPGPGAQPNYSPHRYDLNLSYNPSSGLLTGQEQLTWQNGEQLPINILYFNLWPNAEQYAWYGSDMRVQSVTVDGQPAHFTAQGLDLKVELGRAVAAGQQAVVGIAFTTRLPGGTNGAALGRDLDTQFSLARTFPTLAVLDDRGWNLTPLPSKFGDPYAEPADYRVTIDVPTGTVLGATGRQTAREERDGRWLYHFEANHVTDWGAVGGPALAEAVRSAGGITVQALDPEQTWSDQMADAALAALTYYTQLFGPLPEPHVVVSRMPGLELPGLVSAPTLDPIGIYRSELRNHLAHQWFGGLVNNDQFGEPWLDEGLARYAERRADRAAGEVQLTAHLKWDNMPKDVHVSFATTGFLRFGGYQQTTGDMAALTLEDLEKTIGSARMDQLLKTWVAQYGGRTATGADFLRLAEQVSGVSLKAFWADHLVDPADRVVYQPVLPLGAYSVR